MCSSLHPAALRHDKIRSWLPKIYPSTCSRHGPHLSDTPSRVCETAYRRDGLGYLRCGLLALSEGRLEVLPPRQRRQLEARPQRPSSGLGVTMMRRAMIAGKCGLPALSRVWKPRRQHQPGRAARPGYEPRQHHDAPDDRTVQGLPVRPDGGGRQALGRSEKKAARRGRLYRAARIGRTAIGAGSSHYQVCSVCPACGDTQMGEALRSRNNLSRSAGR